MYCDSITSIFVFGNSINLMQLWHKIMFLIAYLLSIIFSEMKL